MFRPLFFFVSCILSGIHLFSFCCSWDHSSCKSVGLCWRKRGETDFLQGQHVFVFSSTQRWRQEDGEQRCPPVTPPFFSSLQNIQSFFHSLTRTSHLKLALMSSWAKADKDFTFASSNSCVFLWNHQWMERQTESVQPFSSKLQTQDFFSMQNLDISDKKAVPHSLLFVKDGYNGGFTSHSIFIHGIAEKPWPVWKKIIFFYSISFIKYLQYFSTYSTFFTF